MLVTSRTFSRRALALVAFTFVIFGVAAKSFDSWSRDTARAASNSAGDRNPVTPFIGAVVDTDGRVVADAIVVARWNDGRTQRVVTDRFGRYVFMLGIDRP